MDGEDARTPEERTQAITWEAPEHHHIEKSSDWFWALGIIAVAGAATAIFLGNVLFGIVIVLGAAVMFIDELHPHASLESFYIDAEHEHGPHLLIRSQQKTFDSLLVIPIPEEYMEDIDELLGSRLPEEHLEEPLSHRVLEFFGF